MSTRRAGTAAGGRRESSLFRGDEEMELHSDVEHTSNVTISSLHDDSHTSTTLSTAIPGDDDDNNNNLTPIFDEGIISENLPDDTSKGEGSGSENIRSGDHNLLASLPVYLSTSLPTTSSLQIFQYPNYNRNMPLPIPESARSRGLREAMRYRPKAKRVEMELPLDLRPTVYNLERGEEMAKGANVSGSIGQGTKPPPSTGGIKVKKEYEMEDTKSTKGTGPKRLEKTRLESTLVPHQTKYMVGVIRDKALHLTPLDNIIQLRSTMHYLDALDAMAQQEKRRALAEPGEDTDEGSLTEDGGKAKEKRKAQNLSVSVRGDAGGGAAGSRGKGAIMDPRDLLMLADREAESERWIDLDWKDEKSEESKKMFEAQMFAASKTPLECKTRPREYLNYL